MNTTAMNIVGMRMKAMIMGTKLRDCIEILDNDELDFFYRDAGGLFTQYGVPANLLQRLVGADIGSLEAFAEAISGNMALYMYFSELTYGI